MSEEIHEALRGELKMSVVDKQVSTDADDRPGLSPQKQRERVVWGKAISLLCSFTLFKAPGPAVWGYGLWGSVGWDRAISN